jgi:endoglucanase
MKNKESINTQNLVCLCILCFLPLFYYCNQKQHISNPAGDPDLKIYWPEINSNDVTTRTGDKGAVIEVMLTSEKKDSLKLRGKIEEWGWALASVNVNLDLTYTDSIVFYVVSNNAGQLLFGVSDIEKIQYISRVNFNEGTGRIAIALTDFAKSIYLEPGAPKDKSINVSKITSIQLQPEGLGSFDLTIGTILFVQGPKAVIFKSDEKTALSDLDPMQKLTVNGNCILNENGDTVILKGLCSGDPVTMIQENRWNEDYFKQASLWGAKIFRIPVSPWSYHQLDHDLIYSNLYKAVYWCKKYRMYAIIEWHTCGNIIQGIFQDPPEGYETTMTETVDFWRIISLRYLNEPTAAFYEIFNEPAAIEWKGGTLTWKQWREKADEIMDTVYKYNSHAIPLVAGLDWAYDLKNYTGDPLRNTGFVFSVHPYAGRTGEPWEDHWENDFGYLAKKFPIMLTEVGFDPQDTIVPQVYKATEDYGRRIIGFADTRGISWVAFVFYKGSGWPMPLFNNWEDFTPTISGAFFKAELKK